jgi:thiol-disulfide isomerase/thioredoxin
MTHDARSKLLVISSLCITAALLLSSCTPHPSTKVSGVSAEKIQSVPADQLRKAGLDVPTQELASIDFTLETMTGGKVSLSSYRGKVVLLSFWATWCGPCQQEMPAMQKLYDQLRSKGLEIVAVDVGEDKATVAAFLKKNPYTFPVLLDTKGEVAGSTIYSANAIPTNYIIDQNGGILGRKIGIDGPEWTSSVRVALFDLLLAAKTKK